MSNYRQFQAGPDPFGRTWNVNFVWLQTAIAIRHCDSVDVKFALDDGEYREEKVIALMHPWLLDLSKKLNRPLNDAWCLKLAAVHLERMVQTGEDMEKPLVTMTRQDLEAASNELDRQHESARAVIG